MTAPAALGNRSRGYVFDGFRLSVDGTLLVRDGTPLALAPKVLRTLLVLVERAGEVVTKGDLLQSIWPDSFVEDTGLTRNISLLRQALRDDGQRFIVTVPRIGYRFVAPLARVDTPAAPAPAAPAASYAHPPGTSRAWRGHPIVGRDHERAALRAAFDAACEGSGGMIAVTGEPGIGKSTIVEEFLSGLPPLCRVGRGRCSERLAAAEPHLPLLEAIDELIAEDVAAAAALRRFAPTWCAHVSPRSHGSSGLQPGPETRTGSAQRLLRELTICLEEISRDRPVVMFIDDLHWSDLSTVDVIAHLAGRVSRMRVLLVVTYRPSEVMATDHSFGRLRGELIARGHLAELPVALLTIPDVRAYLLTRLGDREIPPELPTLIYRKTEGNPLFMVELVRYLEDRGLPRDGLTEMTREVPASLSGMVERTLQALDPEVREVLSVAALHGYEFESAMVAHVTGRGAGDIEERLQALDHVHRLVALDREHDLPNGTFSRRYRFVHVLYQDALYTSIPPSRRAEWARQLAEALASSHQSRSEVIAGQLAVLFEIGRDPWQASQHFLAATGNAARRFAFREASELARRGLACLDAPAVRDGRDTRRREFDLTFALLVPLASVEGYGAPEIETVTRRLLQLGEGLRDSTVTSAALAATWMVRMVRGDCVAAKDAGVQMVALARAAGNDVLLMNAHMQILIASHHMGELREAQEHADAAIALDSRGYRSERCLTIFDPVVASLAESSRNLWIMGELVRCIDHNERAVALGREIRHPDSLAFAWLFHGWIHGYRGDWTTCLTSVEAGIAVARESGSVQTLAWNRCVHGWALAHTGRIDEGLDAVSAAIEASRAIMGQVAMPQFSAMMSEVLLLRGEVAAAEGWLNQALELSNRQFDRYFDAELHRLAAACLLARGQPEAALDQLRRAIALARLQGAATFELRAALALATHEPTEGLPALRSALAMYPEPEPWPDIEAAREVLAPE